MTKMHFARPNLHFAGSAAAKHAKCILIGETCLWLWYASGRHALYAPATRVKMHTANPFPLHSDCPRIGALLELFITEGHKIAFCRIGTRLAGVRPITSLCIVSVVFVTKLASLSVFIFSPGASDHGFLVDRLANVDDKMGGSFPSLPLFFPSNLTF